jgi:hypothetical protein
MTVGTTQGSNTSPGIPTPTFSSLQNLTLASSYTGTYTVNFDLTVTGSLTLSSGKLVDYTDQGHTYGTLAVGADTGNSTFTFGSSRTGANTTLQLAIPSAKENRPVQQRGVEDTAS